MLLYTNRLQYNVNITFIFTRKQVHVTYFIVIFALFGDLELESLSLKYGSTSFFRALCIYHSLFTIHQLMDIRTVSTHCLL